MTTGGWFTFLLSIGAFTGLFAWCMYKVLTTKQQKEDDIHSAFDIYEKDANTRKTATSNKKNSK